MMASLNWQSSILVIDDKELQMPYAITSAWRLTDAVLILFDPDTPVTSIHPDLLLPGPSGTMMAPAFKNVALASLDGCIKWWSEIHPRNGDDRYVSVTSLDPIQFRTRWEYEVQLSFAKGMIEKERDVKTKRFWPWFPSEWPRIVRRRKTWESCWFLGNRVFRSRAATLEIEGYVREAFESDEIILVRSGDLNKIDLPGWSNLQAFDRTNTLLWTAEVIKSRYTGAIYDGITCLDPLVALGASHYCLIDIENGRLVDSMFTK